MLHMYRTYIFFKWYVRVILSGDALLLLENLKFEYVRVICDETSTVFLFNMEWILQLRGLIPCRVFLLLATGKRIFYLTRVGETKHERRPHSTENRIIQYLCINKKNDKKLNEVTCLDGVAFAKTKNSKNQKSQMIDIYFQAILLQITK